ncbi:N-acetylmuramoyl-L-alanine amidase [Nocardia sp. NPDC050406]|uniref:N-acetylmuramoyl-L-alanine amidase n=1 Tax=Nocardia sp. NPDC050406 TaxID=3364318 RepID=UPI0037B20F0A
MNPRLSRRTLLGGAAALAATGLIGVDPLAKAEPVNETDCRGGLFGALRWPEQTTEPIPVRFRVQGMWTEPIAAQPPTHGRDGRPAPLSEPFAIPAGADRVGVVAETVTAPRIFGPPTKSPFRAPVLTSYAWGFPVVTRSGWGADETRMTWGEPEYSPAQVITVHHSAIPTGEEFDDYRDAVREVYHMHAWPEPDGQGWGDTGYHLIIDPNGVIYTGRHAGTDDSPIFKPGGDLRPGAEIVTAGHVAGANAGNIGICLIGDFTDALPSKAALHSLDIVLTHLCSGLGINPFAQVRYTNPVTGRIVDIPAVSGHRDWQALGVRTACPGDFLHTVLPLLRGLSQLG